MTAKVLVVDDRCSALRGNARKLAKQPKKRLIVYDVNMPRMNGIKFLEQLNANRSEVPIIMLTTEGQPELIQRAKALGAKRWIIKALQARTLGDRGEKAHHHCSLQKGGS